MKNQILMAVMGVALMGCTVNFEAPRDEAAEACKAKVIGTQANTKTTFTCEAFEENGMVKALVPVAGAAAGWKGVKPDSEGNKYLEVLSPAVPPVPSLLPGLVVMVEVGTFEANRLSADSSFQGMMTDQVPEGLQKNIRMFMSNFTKAFLEETVDRVGKKYGHIYFVKSEGRLKEIFLQTLKKATTAHEQVDILMIGHGSPGIIYMKKDLTSGTENLTGQELIDYAKNNLADKADRVRAIFQTHCFTAKPGPNGKISMYEAYSTAFPKAKFYGGMGVNSFPLHRDIVMFEKYYEYMNTAEPTPYETAFKFSEQYLQYTLDGQFRQWIVFPSIKGRGCISIVGFDKCKEMARATAYIAATSAIKNDSKPLFGKGRGYYGK